MRISDWSSDVCSSDLAENERKPRRERLTLIRLYEVLRGLGYDGGYDAVRRHARRWQREEAGRTATAFVPLSFDPGEAYQFHLRHEVIVMVRVTPTVQVAPCRLSHTRRDSLPLRPPTSSVSARLSAMKHITDGK